MGDSAAKFHFGFLTGLGEEGGTFLVIYQHVHRFETFERVFAVEDARVVEVSAFGLEDAATKATIDRRATNEDGDVVSTPMEFVDDKRHLLGGGHEQRGQANCGGVRFDGFGDDRLRRDLLAEVDHVIAVVGENRLDEVLADVMHVAVDRCNHNLALADTFFLLQIIFQMRHGLLHHFGGLKHEGQNQFARAEFVADLFHGGEEDVVEGVDRYCVLRTAY
ncbi:MAG: hypothetical protein PGMFKBFP_02721 [Anaerolineales bacterium]|nr:hypothetical protein [Anaerolineales bacterium]